MRVLFVVPELFYSEPLGVMGLSAICKRDGHVTRLAVLARRPIEELLEEFDPDVVGYSAMTANKALFAEADRVVRERIRRTGKKIFRVMGGPHPTFFPEVLGEMELDAIVIGHGDHALPRILERLERGSPLDGIPNVWTAAGGEPAKEAVSDYDALPFLDRDLIYEAAPQLQGVGIRSFMTCRGCPYQCTYCFNHAFNDMFHRGGRTLLARRSVDSVIAEIRQVREKWPPLRFVQFSDSVFVLRADDWLREFAEKYPREVGLPFICCIQPKDLTDETAGLLRTAGCRALSMSIESGLERVRKEILKRPIPDDSMLDAFAIARRHGLRTQSNVMLGLPGTTLEEDFRSVRFARACRPSLVTFSVFCPFPRTELSRQAARMGLIADGVDYNTMYRDKSVLNCYTEREKEIQVRLTYLSSIFCMLPAFLMRVLPSIARLPLDPLYRLLNSLAVPFVYGAVIFRGAQPANPLRLLRNVFYSIAYYLKWK
jgi:anaerobic magnesium-protoporphyrin IX monomethyl ester cyclase